MRILCEPINLVLLAHLKPTCPVIAYYSVRTVRRYYFPHSLLPNLTLDILLAFKRSKSGFNQIFCGDARCLVKPAFTQP